MNKTLCDLDFKTCYCLAGLKIKLSSTFEDDDFTCFWYVVKVLKRMNGMVLIGAKPF